MTRISDDEVTCRSHAQRARDPDIGLAWDRRKPLLCFLFRVDGRLNRSGLKLR